MKTGVTHIKKTQIIPTVKKSVKRIACSVAILLCCLSPMSCAAPERSRPDRRPGNDDLSVYRVTNHQPGHEFVKTEQFLVPLGTVIVIKGLEFQAGTSTLSPKQELIVQQVFNSLEEITENTVGDTNSARVAKYKKLEFEIRGYPDDCGDNGPSLSLAQARANSVLNLMTYLGTPPWRLKATGIADKNRIVVNARPQETDQHGRIEFIRRR